MVCTFRRHGRAALCLLTSAVVLLAGAASALATFPAHNGLIAFHSQTPAGAQIFTVRSNGHELRQITHVDGDAISVDGRRTAGGSPSRSTPPTRLRWRS